MKKCNAGRMIVLLLAVCAVALGGCAGRNESVANPLHETDAEGVKDAVGFAVEVPSAAENISYSYIEAGEKESTIAQAAFVLDGASYTLRAAETADEGLTADTGDPSAAAKELDAAVAKGAALAGLHYDKWKAAASIDICGCTGVYAHTPEAASVVAWIDAEGGIMYSMTADDEVDQETLTAVAESALILYRKK